MKKEYNKLVRDRVPDNIRAEGKSIVVHQVKDREELVTLLISKLFEEVNELKEEFDKTGNISVEELIDVEEVLDKLKIESNQTIDEIQKLKEEKAFKNGRFDLSLVLESVE